MEPDKYYLEGWDRSSVPQWSHADIELMEDYDYYDGPLMGIITVKGKRYWFDLFCPTDNPGYEYVVLDLNEEEWAKWNERGKYFDMLEAIKLKYENPDYLTNKQYRDELEEAWKRDPIWDIRKVERVVAWF